MSPTPDLTNPTSTVLSKTGITATYDTTVQHISFVGKTFSIDHGLQVSGNVAQFSYDVDASASNDTAASISTAGGLAVAKKAYIGDDLHVTGKAYLGDLDLGGSVALDSTASSTSTITGALTVAGGVGIVENIYVGGLADVAGTFHAAGDATLDSQLSVAHKASFNDEVDVVGILKSSNNTDASSATDNAAAVSTLGGLAVAKKAYIGTNLNVGGDSSLAGALAVTGAATLSSTLGVSAKATLNSLEVTNASNLLGSLAVADGTTLGGDLQVNANASVTGTLAVTQGTTLTGGATISQTAALATMTVSGTSTLTGKLTSNGAADLKSTLDVTGATTLGSSLTVNSGVTLNATSDASSYSDGSAALVVAGGLALARNACIGGLADVNLTLHVGGDATLDGQLSVADTSSLAEVDVSGILKSSNNSNASSASDNTAAISSSGGLAIAKDAYFGGLADVTGNFHVAGDVTFDQALTVTGTATLANLSMSGSLALNGTNDATSYLDTNAALHLDGGLSVVKNAYIGGNVGVTGTFNATGDATLHGTVDIKDAATLESTLDVSLKTTLGAALDVTGAVTLKSIDDASDSATGGALTVKGGMAVAKKVYMGSTLDVAQAASLASTLAVTGAATFSDNVSISGNLTVSGTTTSLNTETLTVKDAAILLANENSASDVIDFGVEGEYNAGSGVVYAGFKRIHGTGEFVFFQNAANQIESQNPSNDAYAVVMADSFNCASDARLKKDVVSLENALDKIDSIRGVHYNWIDENQSKDRQVGVIAQEIQAVYPELVMQGGNGYLSVDYPKLTAVLIQSVKELKAMVLALANK
uniref:Peptidase S74 domain-containing protein n=1 Tax=viral metagenome TaxID=1070528 RepID=A0A6C0KT08_9ZZZZ